MHKEYACQGCAPHGKMPQKNNIGMKNTLIPALLYCAAPTIVSAADAPSWQTNLPAAMQQAEKENKLLLLDFTGSDWCTSCIQLRRTVLDNSDFLAWAKEHFIFVEIDLPQRKKLDADLLKHNKAVAERYEVRGLPTIMILTPQGRVTGGFLGNIGNVKDARTRLTAAITAAEAFENAAKLEGKARAMELMKAYRGFPSEKAFATPHQELRDEIRKLDPDNATGIHEDAAVREQATRFLAQRNALYPNSPEYGKLIDRQLAETLPQNKGEVLMAKCQYMLTTANSIAELEETRNMFEECMKFQSEAEAAETQEFLNRFFTDLPALLNMLRSSRPH